MIGMQALGERVKQLGKARQHKTNYKIGSRNFILRKFREIKRMIISTGMEGRGSRKRDI